MGVLRHLTSNRLFSLPARVVVGRSGACGLRCDDPRVSSEHAVVAWRAEGWFVRDLGSRNGTMVDDLALGPGGEVALAAGSKVRFAGDGWTLDDASPPGAFAVALDGRSTVAAEGSVLLLPSGESPAIAWWPAPDGTWRAEVDGEDRPAVDQEVVEVRGRAWRVHLPVANDPTVRGELGLGLHFFVSSDEERVEVEVIGAPVRDRLRARSHLYLLLTLARQRAAESSRKQVDRGWVTRDDLAWRLKVDAATINVHLYRIRQDLGKQGDAAANLIEVRPRVGQVRVGTDHLRFGRLDG